MKNLPRSKVLEAETHDHHYDYDLFLPEGVKIKDRHCFSNRLAMSIAKRLPKGLSKKLIRNQVNKGYPYPQTLKSGALAQIQVVAQKTK